MEHKSASLNKLGDYSWTEMHLASTETSLSVKFLGSYQKYIERHHYHPGLPEPLFAALSFMFP